MSFCDKCAPERNGKSPLVVLGAGGTGLYMAEVAERTGRYHVAGFLDDDPIKQAEGYCGHPVLGTLAYWSNLPANTLLINSLYGPKKNQKLAGVVASLGVPDCRWATIVDPSAVVSSRATLLPGCFVGMGCVVEPMAKCERLCALLGNVYMAHHTQLGAYTVLANSVSIAGGVVVGSTCYIGANSTLREYIHIGTGVTVGMGAVVTKSVTDGDIVVGNPARRLCH